MAVIKKSVSFIWYNFEAFFWAFALILLAFASTDFSSHATLCPFSSLGFTYCPGCGLGRSIILAFHGRLAESFEMHPVGIFAIFMLIYRIFSLFNKNYSIYKMKKP